jgi:hypothetical protein
MGRKELLECTHWYPDDVGTTLDPETRPELDQRDQGVVARGTKCCGRSIETGFEARTTSAAGSLIQPAEQAGEPKFNETDGAETERRESGKMLPRQDPGKKVES